MATITLNLPIESQVAERIKKYADKQKTSVSTIVENFFTSITSESTQGEITEISPLVRSFSIENVNIPTGFDYKKELANTRNEKYL